MPEPMVPFPPTRNYRPLTRAHLRQRYGPSNPLYEMLEPELTVDVCPFIDDEFRGVLYTNTWTTASNGAGGTAWAQLANRPNGVIRGIAGTDDNADVTLFTTSGEIITANRRPVLMTRLGMNSAVTTSKWEFGFADAVNADGCVNVKATPSSTGTDYAVIIRDTTDDVLVSMITDGGTDAAASVDPSPALPATFASQTWYNLLIALNEDRDAVYYIDGRFSGILRTGPDATVTLGVWAIALTRSGGAVRSVDLDYVKGWQERVPFSGDAFTT